LEKINIQKKKKKVRKLVDQKTLDFLKHQRLQRKKLVRARVTPIQPTIPSFFLLKKDYKDSDKKDKKREDKSFEQYLKEQQKK